MKKNKCILMIQMITMYGIHLPFYFVLIFARVPVIPLEIIGILLMVGLFLNLAMIPVIIASLVIALLGLVKNRNCPIKTTLNVKLSLIPWYVLNFLVCLLLVAGFLNPWLMLAVPLLVFIEVMITYLYMISTSFQITSYVIQLVINNELKLSGKLVLGIVFLYIFCLDIVGTLLIQSELAKEER